MLNQTGRRVAWLVLLAVNVALWAIPSDVVELAARDRDVLLGRYSRTHLVWCLAVAALSAAAVPLVAAPDRLAFKRRSFRTVAIFMALMGPTCMADLALRTRTPVYYIKDTLAYHRPPHATYRETIHDRPKASISLPHVPPGYPDIEGVLRTDARGFRNPADLAECDVVALGDSFTEGSKVSDEHPWPMRFSELSGLSVINLGMSGYAPQNYLASLAEVGLPLHPRLVICMLYEENDFRAVELRDEPESELDKFFKRSPILAAMDEWIVGKLGPMGARRAAGKLELLSWLPVRVPSGPQGRPYTFSPKLMLDLYKTEQQVTDSRQWTAMTSILAQMKKLCHQAGAAFVLVYTPSKPHVVAPLAADALPADQVRDTVARVAGDDLPEGPAFLMEWRQRMDVKETLTRRWCADNGVSFVSLTETLRRRAAEGVQVYFTYDDHFSPPGHQTAAQAIYEWWQASGK